MLTLLYYCEGIWEWGGGRDHIRYTENKTVISRTFQFIIFHDILHGGFKNTIHDTVLASRGIIYGKSRLTAA